MTPPLLELCGAVRAYRRGSRPVTAVDGVDLILHRGDVLGIAGESGAGKSTLARLMLGLESLDAGALRIDGLPFHHLGTAARHAWRRRAQLVPQDPLGSLNPTLPVGLSIAEPLLAHRLADSAGRRLKVTGILQDVGLPPSSLSRRPGEFSGGQRQRLAIARALVPDPELLILDEPVSALDPPLRGRILDLLDRLVRDRSLTVVLISHELEPLRRLAGRTLVLFRGVVVEDGPTSQVLGSPAHPYTRELVRADGGVAAPLDQGPEDNPAGACRYLARCSVSGPRCRHEPALSQNNEHRSACWFPVNKVG